MAAKRTSEEERIRIAILLPGPVAQELAKHAKELQRSQAWVANWALSCGYDAPADIGNYLSKLLKNLDESLSRVTPGQEGEFRLQIRVEPKIADWLEKASTAIYQSPGKFAALVVDLMMQNNGDLLYVMKTSIGKYARRLVRGQEDFTKSDVVDSERIESESQEGDQYGPEKLVA